MPQLIFTDVLNHLEKVWKLLKMIDRYDVQKLNDYSKVKKLSCFLHDAETVLSTSKKPLTLRIVRNEEYGDEMMYYLKTFMKFVRNCKECKGLNES